MRKVIAVTVEMRWPERREGKEHGAYQAREGQGARADHQPQLVPGGCKHDSGPVRSVKW
jgi:hypothetical protein